MGIAVILAILSALLIAGLSYVLFPDQTPDQMPIPKPAPSILDQIFGVVLWIGLAALVAIVIVGAILLVNQVRSKKTDKNIEIIV